MSNKPELPRNGGPFDQSQAGTSGSSAPYLERSLEYGDRSGEYPDNSRGYSHGSDDDCTQFAGCQQIPYPNPPPGTGTCRKKSAAQDRACNHHQGVSNADGMDYGPAAGHQEGDFGLGNDVRAKEGGASLYDAAYICNSPNQYHCGTEVGDPSSEGSSLSSRQWSQTSTVAAVTGSVDDSGERRSDRGFSGKERKRQTKQSVSVCHRPLMGRRRPMDRRHPRDQRLLMEQVLQGIGRDLHGYTGATPSSEYPYEKDLDPADLRHEGNQPQC